MATLLSGKVDLRASKITNNFSRPREILHNDTENPPEDKNPNYVHTKRQSLKAQAETDRDKRNTDKSPVKVDDLVTRLSQQMSQLTDRKSARI